jgi:hypothetical protein
MDFLLFIITNLQEYLWFLYFQNYKSKITTREDMVKNPLQGFNIYL